MSGEHHTHLIEYKYNTIVKTTAPELDQPYAFLNQRDTPGTILSLLRKQLW